ncbi:MAG: hypothetical protein HZB59_01830 [Ignavibacteriales bacterium]|nr:hypothetical protein [Ignavibacteriales bacterium]
MKSNYHILFLVIFLFLNWGCPNPSDPGSVHGNLRPRTRLSNVPPPEDTTITKNPRLTLNWIGDDADGYIVAFMYRWNYVLDNQQQYRKYNIILNIIVDKFALMVETENPLLIPAIYKHFANLVGNEGLSTEDLATLRRGDTIAVQGIRVYASNPDSILLQTGSRVRYSFPVHTNPNSGTFIFESPDRENLHTFEVSAIDNLGITSETFAKVSFITPQVQAPHGKVTGWSGGSDFEQKVIVRKDKTPTFQGIRFEYKGVDPNTRSMDYRWVVDKDKWLTDSGYIPWSAFTTNEYAYVTAKDFADPYDTVHTFTVQARNEFGAIDTTGLIYDDNGNVIDSAWRTFKTIYPKFLRDSTERILILNNCYDRLMGTPAYPYYWDVDSFYHSILHGLGKHDSIIDNFRMSMGVFPDLGEIGKYSLVIYVADVPDALFSIPVTFSKKYEMMIRDYCYIGGDFIMGGWNLSSQLNMIRDEEFFRRVIHVDFTSPQYSPDLFVRAIGQNNYPDLYIDTAKADPSWRDGMSHVPINLADGFGEILHKYDAKYDSIKMENASLSVIYRGVTFNSCYLGIPLYYMERPAADSTISRILYDFKRSKEERSK